MINSTSLRHPTMRRKIIEATSHVIHKQYSVEHVRNAEGHAVLAIRQHDGVLKVTDRYGRDVTQLVAKSF